MNRLDQSRRDHQIAADAATGSKRAELARRYGVSERTVRRALGRVQRADGGAQERLADFHRYLDAAIEQLGFDRLQARNPRTRIAALRLQMDLMRDRERPVLGASAEVLSRDHDARVRMELMAALLALAIADGLDQDVLGWLKETAEANPG